MKTFLLVALFIIPFGCEEVYEDDLKQYSIDEPIEALVGDEEFTIINEEVSVDQSRGSSIHGDYYFSDQSEFGINLPLFHVDSYSDAITVRLDYDAGDQGIINVILYKRWYSFIFVKQGSVVFNPPTGGVQQYTWYNMQSNKDYLVTLNQNPGSLPGEQWLGGDYSISWN